MRITFFGTYTVLLNRNLRLPTYDPLDLKMLTKVLHIRHIKVALYEADIKSRVE